MHLIYSNLLVYGWASCLKEMDGRDLVHHLSPAQAYSKELALLPCTVAVDVHTYHLEILINLDAPQTEEEELARL